MEALVRLAEIQRGNPRRGRRIVVLNGTENQHVQVHPYLPHRHPSQPLSPTVLAMQSSGAPSCATGSGAGCGSSQWPLCNGVIVPRAPSLQTPHRVYPPYPSGVTAPPDGLAVLCGLPHLPQRPSGPRRHDRLRPSSRCSKLLVGAGLVLLQLVMDSHASVARGYWM